MWCVSSRLAARGRVGERACIGGCADKMRHGREATITSHVDETCLTAIDTGRHGWRGGPTTRPQHRRTTGHDDYSIKWLQYMITTAHNDCSTWELQHIMTAVHEDCSTRWLQNITNTAHNDYSTQWLQYMMTSVHDDCST